MSQAKPEISVIIPTTCEISRKKSLLRAIDSVCSQEGVDVEIIVVVNGKRYDPEFLQELKNNSQLNVQYQDEGSLPAALRYGRSMVGKKYFSFLDDDDEYLPDALINRAKELENNNNLDIVVTNGYTYTDRDRIRIDNISAVRNDPLASLIQENWLASCGGLFRSGTVHLDYFDGKTKYFEWTFLAFKLLINKHCFSFLDIPTFRVHDTASSLSKSEDYRLAIANFVRQLLSYDTPDNIKKSLKSKLAAALHSISGYYLRIGRKHDAWRYHIESISWPDGLKYLLYTRKFFL
jgi:glycosyltransferase involved in cell wall biosynthesis